MDVDLGKWRRVFPFAVDGEECPECGGWMTEEYVREPAIQEHWRGVPALVCEDCDHAILRDDGAD